MLHIIFATILFGMVTAFLYAWGYVKEQRKNNELVDQLISKSREKVLKEMKKGKSLTNKDIRRITEGNESSLFWSKSKMHVTDLKLFVDRLIETMVSEGTIKEIKEGNKKKYTINKEAQ